MVLFLWQWTLAKYCSTRHIPFTQYFFFSFPCLSSSRNGDHHCFLGKFTVTLLSKQIFIIVHKTEIMAHPTLFFCKYVCFWKLFVVEIFCKFSSLFVPYSSHLIKLLFRKVPMLIFCISLFWAFSFSFSWK